MTVLSSIYEDEEDLEKIKIASYKLISYEKRTLKIKINFAQPRFISVDAADKEELRVTFVLNWFFLSEDGR